MLGPTADPAKCFENQIGCVKGATLKKPRSEWSSQFEEFSKAATIPSPGVNVSATSRA